MPQRRGSCGKPICVLQYPSTAKRHMTRLTHLGAAFLNASLLAVPARGAEIFQQPPQTQQPSQTQEPPETQPPETEPPIQIERVPESDQPRQPRDVGVPDPKLYVNLGA